MQGPEREIFVGRQRHDVAAAAVIEIAGIGVVQCMAAQPETVWRQSHEPPSKGLAHTKEGWRSPFRALDRKKREAEARQRRQFGEPRCAKRDHHPSAVYCAMRDHDASIETSLINAR
jgi:hypothetical protein